MKRILVIALLMFYASASFGVNINLFYCCGELEAVSLALPQSDTDDCSAAESKGCCEHKTISVKQLQSDQNTPIAAVALDQMTAIALLPETQNLHSLALGGNYQQIVSSFYEAPPPDLFPSRRILFGVFRI